MRNQFGNRDILLKAIGVSIPFKGMLTSVGRRIWQLLIWLVLCAVLTCASTFLFPAESVAGIALTAEEKNWLEQNPDKLVLWFNTDFPPIEFASDTGEFIGMGADIISLVERQLGITFIKQASNDWNEHLAALQSGVCAVAPTIVETAERKRYAYFTAAYASAPVVIIAGKALEDQALSDLGGRRVAVVSGYATEDYLRASGQRQIEVVPMPDVPHALRATSFGQVDAYVENLAVAAYYIEKEGIPNLRVAGSTPYSFSWRIGVSRRYPLLAGAVEKALASIPAKEIESVRKRWVSLEIDTRWSSRTLFLFVALSIFVVLLALGLLVISTILRRSLKDKIAGLITAQKKILEQAKFLELAAEATQAGIWDFNVGERSGILSSQWFAMLGYDREGGKVPSNNFEAYVHPDDRPVVGEKFNNYVNEGGQGLFEAELRLRQADGNWCWVLNKGKVVQWDEEGKPERIIGLAVKIQTLKDAQEETRKSEERFRRLFMSAPVPLVLLSLDGTVSAINDAMVHTFGYTIEEIPNLDHWWPLAYPDPEYRRQVKSAWAHNMNQSLTDHSPFKPDEYYVTCKNGKVVRVRFNINFLGNMIIGSLYEVTELREKEEALQQSMEQLRATLNATNDGILVVNKNLKVIQANRQFYEMWRIPSDLPNIDDDVTLRKFVQAQLEDPDGFMHLVDKLYTTQCHEMFEIRFKDGRVFECSSVPMVIAAQEAGRAWDFRDITDRKKAEDAIDFERRQLLSIFDNMPGFIYVSDPQTHELIYVNQRLKNILGKDPTGEICYEVLQGVDRPCDFCTNAIILDNDGQPYRWEYHNPKLHIDVDIVDQIIRWPDGRDVRLEIAQDITEQKRDKQALIHSEEKLRSIFAAMNDVVLIFDAGGRLLEIAPTKTDLLYRPKDEILGKNLREIFSSEKADTFMDAIGNAISRNESVALDYELTIGTRPTWFSATISPMSANRVVLVARDITNRKQAEEQLRQSEERFSKIFTMTPLNLAISSLEEGKIIDVNNGFEDLTGWKKNEVLGLTTAEINFWTDPSFRSEIGKELKAGREVLSREVEFRRKDGRVGNALFSARPIMLSGEMSALSVMQDITEFKKVEMERQKLQEQLLQAQKMEAVGTLAGGVAHDFNNMLGAIIGYAELALNSLGNADPMRETLSVILDSALRSADLTRQLLAFARKEVIEPVLFDINQAVENLLKMLQRLIGENIELRWLPGQGPLKVRLDPSQLDQVLANLCVNARDAIADIGCIAIETELKIFDEQTCTFHPDCKTGEYVVLSLSDNGPGMAKETLNHIFEPFFTTKGRGKGTGLGLSTVYGIVRQNDGIIDVYSEPGKGTTFTIYFPRDEGEADEKHKAPKKVLESHGETVLLVEDDPVLLEMSTMMLHHLGYRVLAANTPTKALRLAQESRREIQMFLTDVVMPEMTGRELGQKLEEIQPGIKHLFMSGYTADVIVHQGVLEEGINFIHKPFSLQGLSEKIRSVLNE